MKTGEASVGAFEAKNKFSELLARVHHGAEVVITKHDRPVAKLVPVSAPLEAERKKTSMELRALSKRYSLKGLSVRELIDKGRR
jgi:prevent-host-death family protein